MESQSYISNQPPAGPPATIQTRVQSAPPARLSEALRRWSTNHRGSSDKSTHTHAGDTPRSPAGAISHLPYTKHYSHDTRGSGGAAAAAAVARAGGRTRTGRSSDRLGGRCSVCLSAPSVRSSSAVRCTGKRGGAGTRGGGGEQASGPRAARRTGDRQAGDGPESDRAQRSEKTSRSSLGRS